MAEKVFPHGTRNGYLIQVCYDPEQLAAPWSGRALDIDGNTRHQTGWTTGNGAAITLAEAWCDGQPHEHAARIKANTEAPEAPAEVKP